MDEAVVMKMTVAEIRHTSRRIRDSRTIVGALAVLVAWLSSSAHAEAPAVPAPQPQKTYSEMSGTVDNSLEGMGEPADFDAVKKRVEASSKAVGKKDSIESIEAELERLHQAEVLQEERKRQEDEKRLTKQRRDALNGAREANEKRKKIRASMAKEVDGLPRVTKTDTDWRGLD